MIRLMLVDDNPRFRTLLTRVLSRYQDLILVGEADSGAQAIEQARALQPDASIMDFHVPGMDGVEAARRIKDEFPWIAISILTGWPPTRDAQRILRGGFYGLFLKDEPVEQIVTAVHHELRCPGVVLVGDVGHASTLPLTPVSVPAP